MKVDFELEGIRTYLQGLSHDKQVELLRYIEVGYFADQDLSKVTIMEGELRRLLHQAGYYKDRLANPLRAFFEPLEPYLVDGQPTDRTLGQIPRRSLKPIWVWISRDLLPDAAKQYEKDLLAAVRLNDLVARENLVREFRAGTVKIAAMAISSSQGKAKASKRLTLWGGLPRTIDDLRRALSIFERNGYDLI